MRQSLLARLLLFTLLFLLLLMAAVGYVLDTVYRQGQVQEWQQQMKIHSYNLLALLDQSNGQLVLPKQLPDQRFNQQDSGLFAVIERGDETLWRAPSTVGLGRFSSGWSSAGDWQFSRASNGEQELLVARFGFDWMPANTATGIVTYNLVFAENSHRLDQQAFAFRQQLWSLLAEIVVALMILQVLILTLGLRPLRRMSDELTRLERGQQAVLSDDYPRELRPLISNFNRVLSSEQAQRERYRNTVADVSHSLKTPLSVLGGMLPQLSLPEQQQQEVQQQLQRMADTVQYQLQRATTGSRISAAQRIVVKPILESVISALKKVYADKQISWQLKCDDGCFFYGDDNDLMEIVGNLIDNACKYGRHTVHITLKKNQQYCTLTVDDDGAGVPPEHHEQIMRRGVRLDSQQPGQGFGLALVKDILDAYQAQLTISQSSLGGASFSVRWKGGQSSGRI